MGDGWVSPSGETCLFVYICIQCKLSIVNTCEVVIIDPSRRNHAVDKLKVNIMTNVNEATQVPTRFTRKAATLLCKVTKGEESARKAAQAAYDQMVSDNMLWTDWLPVKTEGSTATPELREALFAARREGFGAWAPKLHATPNKALSADKIAQKNKLRTDLNKKITDDKEAMRLRLDVEYRASKSKAKDRAPKTPTVKLEELGLATGKDKILESLNQAKKRLQETEKPTYDPVALLAAIEGAITLANTAFEPKH